MQTSQVVPVWKSSSLAVMRSGLVLGESLEGAVTIKELTAKAGSSLVTLFFNPKAQIKAKEERQLMTDKQYERTGHDGQGQFIDHMK